MKNTDRGSIMENDNNEHIDKVIKLKKFNNDGVAAYAEPDAPLWYIKSRNAIYYVLGVIEVLLAFRFIFRLLGANPLSGFVSFIYSITGIFIAPFWGIFNSFVSNGLAARSVFEPATVIGMAVYAIAAWGIVRLLKIKVSKDGH